MTNTIDVLSRPKRPDRLPRRRLSRRLNLESLESRRVLATTLAGTVFNDLDGNAVIGAGEPGQGGVTVYIDANGNDMLDIVGDVVEPDDFGAGEAISFPGVSFSVAGEDNSIRPSSPAVISAPDAFASTGERVFAHGEVEDWDFEARLRMDFDPPVSAVQINITGERPTRRESESWRPTTRREISWRRTRRRS